MFIDHLAIDHRKVFQRIAVVFFVFFTLSVLDLVAFILAESRTVFKVVAGREINVSGKLAEPIDRNLLRPPNTDGGDQGAVDFNHLLTYGPGDSSYTLRFTGIEGRLWRGIIRVEPFAAPADHSFKVLPHGVKADAEVPTYHLFVYSDETGYRRSFLSLSKRLTGIDPLWLPLLLLPGGLLLFVAVFRASREEDRRLGALGIGPIYKLARRKDHWEIIFGLGASHGVRPGDRLTLLDDNRQPVGEIVAAEVSEDHATATVDRRAVIRAEYLIARVERVSDPSAPHAAPHK